MNRTTTFIDSLGALLWNPGTGVLIALLIAAAWIDWRTMRIPNWLTVGGMCWGFFASAATSPSFIDGIVFSAGGFGLGLAIFLPLWMLRVMGAGDVKLMSMTGSFLGAAATFQAALLVGIVGGIAVVIFAIAARTSRHLASNAKTMAASMLVPGMPLWRPERAGVSVGRLPYGVSISVGTVLFLFLRQLSLA